MVGESHQNVLLIQIDVSSFAEFEISEFEIARDDCTMLLDLWLTGTCILINYKKTIDVNIKGRPF